GARSGGRRERRWPPREAVEPERGPGVRARVPVPVRRRRGRPRASRGRRGRAMTAYRSPHPDVEIPDTPLTPFVLGRAEELADKPALIDGPSGRVVPYAALAAQIRALAAGLAARGFGKGDVFAVYLPNVPEYPVAFHGVALAGGMVTTVNPLYTVGELATQLRASGARWLLTIGPFLDVARQA